MSDERARRRAVFLDRDGVLNRAILSQGTPFAPRHVEDLEILPGAREACALLREAGLLLVVVTNQPDVARGSLTLEQLSAIHEELLARIPVDAILFCPHNDADACGCRKPAPGLLLEAADRWNIDLECSVMVGDRWRDIEAGRRAGCGTVFVDAGYEEERPRGQDVTATSLSDALPWILGRCAFPEKATR